jgi:hypothetical protein
MLPSTRAFLSGLIDYAGLFPPAQLPMEQSIHNYICYLRDPDSWMLGRFICPAARLAELSAFQQAFTQLERPLNISALGRSGKDANTFLDGLRQDLQDISRFRETHGNHVEIDVYEVKLPPGIPASVQQTTDLTSLLQQAAQLIEQLGPPKLNLFFETALAGSAWQNALENTISAMNTFNKSQLDPHSQPAGFKLRCGGVDASAFPSTFQVAAVLATCRQARIPLKLTAGLHHPFRHFDPSLQANMHGFINLFAAGILAPNLDLAQLQEVIDDQNPDNFILDSTGLRWQKYSAVTSTIIKDRHEALISFGSCSFDEPREDLRQLGFI